MINLQKALRDKEQERDMIEGDIAALRRVIQMLGDDPNKPDVFITDHQQERETN